MIRCLFITTMLLFAAGCLTSRPGVSALDLPEDPARVTVIQRHSEPLPGSDGKLRIKIGDITAGQVLMEIGRLNPEELSFLYGDLDKPIVKSGDRDQPLVELVSVQVGDVIPLPLNGREYYVTVAELQNFLIGDDFAVFEISIRKPVPRPEPPMSDDTPTTRPSTWAEPIQLEGAPNLHAVCGDLYRSAQPTEVGMLGLEAMGIETVVSLRAYHSDHDEIIETGLGYEHIVMRAWRPKQKQVVRFLRIVTNPKRAPVLVHCQHGADRTGLMCAIYRVAVQGWTKEEAIREMTQGGYDFHKAWVNIVPWFRKLDIDHIKTKAGLQPRRD